ncbi:hypothetical protein [Ferrovibrio terrae]|uniref:hypothetical protein n=1 Tax=Ferrovibrio terrae TaxID=2594003 RepID=UPI0031380767
MKWAAASEQVATRRAEIQYDPSVGYYLYIFDSEDCTYDYLQDTFEIAVAQAEEDFGIPSSAWRSVSS